MEQPLPAERHRRIAEILRERRAVRVSALAETLGVSEVTIRRDLEEMEQRGLLERTHGGAIESQRLRFEPAYLEAEGSYADEKRLIGRTAAQLARPGETLFLNGGTTTLEVFRHLEVPVKVVTNHVGIAAEAAVGPHDVHVLGGEFRPNSRSCVGVFATEALRRVFASRAFIGVEGFSIRSGLTTPAAAESDLAKVMIEQTQGPVVVVADGSKVGTVAEFAISDLDRVDVLVTGRGIDDEYRDELTALGLDVIVAGLDTPATASLPEVVGG